MEEEDAPDSLPLVTKLSAPSQAGCEAPRKPKPGLESTLLPSLSLCLAHYVHVKKVILGREKWYVDENLTQTRRMDPEH